MTTEAAIQNEPPAAPAEPGGSAPAEPTGDEPTSAASDDPAPEAPSEPAHDPDDGEPKQNAKAEAARKGHQTRQKKAARRAQLAEDADVQVLIDQAIKRGEAKAKEQAAEEARLASLSELERAQAETEKLRADIASKEAELGKQRLEREYGDALIESGLKVRPKSRGMFRRQVADAMEVDSSLTPGDAIHLVAEEHDYLLAPEPKSTSGGASAAPQSKRKGASTSPAPKRETAEPAKPEAPKPVDVMKMSKQEYREYRRTKHGINLPL